MERQYKVIVSECARQMLGRHICFLAQINPPAARRVKERLLTAIRSLKSMPERFPFLDVDPVPKDKYRKLFVENWYLILYQIEEQTVFVEYIVDCRQDYVWLIQ
ncbi:MAG: type II toxin-antitoxin system RelE/ParE family toxin [Treponema sp.]|nr:type II toxin-antitoxin system RelE/ParE family toxin [Treponema sp.]